MSLPRFVQRLFANNGAGPKLRHDIIPWDEEKSLVALEAWRQAMIGTPMPMAGTTLPPGFMWADGSFASFAVYPELKARYDAGGFTGMLLAYNASEEDIAAYPGKFKPDAAKPTGLFVPRLNGLFARYCAEEGEVGAYQADAIQTGVTRLIVGAWSPDSSAGIVSPIGNVTVSTESTTSGAVASTAPLRYLVDINQRTADKTRPENVSLPIALYLGRAAEI